MRNLLFKKPKFVVTNEMSEELKDIIKSFVLLQRISALRKRNKRNYVRRGRRVRD